MSVRKNTVVAEAVMGSVTAIQRRWIILEPNRRQMVAVGGALLVSFAIIVALLELSGNGNLHILHQRLFGSVQLSTGTFSARSAEDLNQLSWGNGLDIMDALDEVNQHINAFNKAQASPKLNQENLSRLNSAIQASNERLTDLLNDRKAIQESAKVLKIARLYTPVYQEYLNDTRKQLKNHQELSARDVAQK